MRPVIGLVVDGLSRAEGTRLAQVIDEAGGAPVRWPLAAAGPQPSDELLDTWLKGARGVLFWPMSEEPPAWIGRRSLLARIERRRLPMLAAEEGMRAICSWAGGRESTPEGHAMRRHFCPQGSVQRHAVTISPLSRLDLVYGEADRLDHIVGSRHRWRISRRPAAWMSSSLAADGTIESLEFARAEWWALAVAWPLTGAMALANEELLVRELVERAR